ncbi:NAD(P)-dependent alcohol dehydrogenase [Nonomuraea turkmeniaca]|uniref:NAD(P)-dependent alcohol dehydrogenase n=1 Tax=Nonomuraea turkmeniaca TaxID=103838 RepID=A0A5S4FBZ0_9ACTN|nr:NAD(P)-dependent alcohol dehydrogenase [Nonomuraea turkmeniaca]TMR14650.1 NAD(P)-dependent alcohol dehydrogenase [Nonomuraea turkmeniaca]
MKAIRYYRYGSPDVLALEDVDPPPVGDDDVLVKVLAASVNPLDVHFMRGTPYLLRAQAGPSRPKSKGLGGDMAGRVEAVGRNVTRFQPGDEVFGGRGIAPVERSAAFAEYASFRQDRMLRKKPANLTFEQAAGVPVAALTAVQALRDKGHVQAGQKVLVNGAAGGVGTFTVQLAKAYGAEVTGVCGTGNVELVRSIGADHVVDYTQEDFTRAGRRYDLMIDMAGNHPLSAIRRVLAPKGVLVGVGGPVKGLWISPVIDLVKMLAYSRVISQRMTPMLARISGDDLDVLREFIEAGKVTPVIGRTYPLSAVPDAIRHLEEGHARGKVVITV